MGHPANSKLADDDTKSSASNNSTNDNDAKEQQEQELPKLASISDPNYDVRAPAPLIEKQGFMSKLFFNYAFPIINKAGHSELEIEDFGGLKEEELLQTRLQKVEEIYEAQQEKNILLAVMTASKAQYIRSFIIQICQAAFDMLGPLCLSRIIAFLQDKEDHDYQKGVMWVCVLIFSYFIRYLMNEHGFSFNLASGIVSQKIIRQLLLKK